MDEQRLIELYRADVGSRHLTTKERTALRLVWLRAVMETLHERSITVDALPVRPARKDRVERFLPFWRRTTDDELFALLDYVRKYWVRPENRGFRL